MDLTVIQRFQKFKLLKKEESGFQLEPKDFQASKEECLRSMIKKIYSEKAANYIRLRNILTIMWISIGPVKIREMGVNLYQFVFAYPEDQMRVLNGKAWTFDS